MSSITNPRLKKNNFDLLRLLFASFVVYWHVYMLAVDRTATWIIPMFSSDMAVRSFFAISGFLIFMSYERSDSLRSYFKKRFLRVYPAMFVVVMSCALGLYFVSTANAKEYFSITWLKYVLANLTFLNFLQPTLVGVFSDHWDPAINASLWTLKVEVSFYLFVPFCVFLMRRLGRFRVLAFFYVTSVVYSAIMLELAARTGSRFYIELSRQLPGQLGYFVTGAFFYYFLPLFERRVAYFVVPAFLIYAVNKFYPLPFLLPFAVATLVVFAGLYFYLGQFGKYGDFSYGVYIVHIPITHLLIHAGWFNDNTYALVAATFLLTGISGIAMWHIVEKRFLSRRRHQVATMQSPSAREARVMPEVLQA